MDLLCLSFFTPNPEKDSVVKTEKEKSPREVHMALVIALLLPHSLVSVICSDYVNTKITQSIQLG